MKNNKLSGIIIALVFFLGTSMLDGTNVLASTRGMVEPEKAQKIATIHVSSVIQNEIENDVEGWKWGVILSEPKEMYDIDGNISAYYMTIVDEYGEDKGYVVVGAVDKCAPIIEYSMNGRFYPEYEMKQLGARRMIYNGGYNYYIETNENIIDVSDFGVARTVDDCCRIIGVENDYSDEWSGWLELLEGGTKNSNPPSSGTVYITNPDSYESGYDSKISANVTGYNKTYKTTSSFSGYNNHCAPTAATNIMLYWYGRNNSTYSSLRKNGDATWTDTFIELYSLMGTSCGGTPNSNLKAAYKTYLINAGFSPIVTYYSTASWSNMKSEIDANYPFHMVIQNHYLYGNHSVVGLGYVQYKYGLASYSRYIRIADGWTTSSGRFVHTTVGNDKIRMVKVHPN